MTRASALVVAAKRNVQKTRRALINDDPTLAAAVVHALGGAYMTIPVRVATVEPGIPQAADLPVAYVIDTDPERTGLAGEVEIAVYGPAFLGTPDAEEFVTLLRNGGAVVPQSDRPRFVRTDHGDVREYRANVRVLRAQPEYPHWSDAGQAAATALHDLALSFSDHMAAASSPGRYGLGSSLPIASRFVSGRVVSSKSAGRGFTDTTVEWDMDLRTSAYGKTQAAAIEIRDEIYRDADRYVRGWSKARGRSQHIRSASVSHTDVGSGSQIPVRVTAVLRSRDEALTLADVDQ